jgi:chromosome partitioning protein
MAGMVVALAGLKGGAGKTMLAVNLATCAVSRGLRVVVVDADPQASASLWASLRDESLASLRITSAPTARSPEAAIVGALGEARGAQIVIIDLPPRGEAAARAARTAGARLVVPVRPAVFDVGSVSAWEPAREGMIVLNMVAPNAERSPAEAREALEGAGMRVVRTAISRRAAFERAAGRGMGVVEMEPHSTAAEEMWALARELNLVNGARG